MKVLTHLAILNFCQKNFHYCIGNPYLCSDFQKQTFKVKEYTNMTSILRVFILSLLIGLANITPIQAGGSENEGELNVGKFITHHIADEHQISIFNQNIPLPVILYSPEAGMSVFSYSKLKGDGHGHGAEYEGYFIDADHHIARKDGATFYDFSITKVVATIFLTMLIMFFVFISVAKAYTKNRGKAPSGLQSFIEPLIVFVRDDIAKPNIPHGKHEKYMPYLLTVFFFIWIANMLGQIPFIGAVNVTGNIAITFVLALFTFILTLLATNKHFWSHTLNPPGVPLGVKLILVPIEVIGIITKPFALMIRLFANITAGHIIILSLVSIIFIFGSKFGTGAGFGSSLMVVPFSIFMGILEILVAFLQAFIFTILSALFIGLSMPDDHHAEAHH